MSIPRAANSVNTLLCSNILKQSFIKSSDAEIKERVVFLKRDNIFKCFFLTCMFLFLSNMPDSYKSIHLFLLTFLFNLTKYAYRLLLIFEIA